MIRVGLIGYGLAGKVFHEPLIRSVEGFVLHKILVKDKKKHVELENRLGEGKVLDDESVFFSNDSGVDLVVITTPNTDHYRLAKKALESGRHVLVEKPFTVTSMEAYDLIAIANPMGQVLCVNQNRRFDGDFLTVKKVLEAGLLGRIVEFESHFDRFRVQVKENAWRESEGPGSGILYDLGSHLIDQALVLFGMPEKVFADLMVQRESAKAVDSFVVVLRYPHLRVTLRSGSLVKVPRPRFRIQGDSGMYIKYGLDVQEDALKAGALPKDHEDWGEEQESQWGSIDTVVDGVAIVGKIKSEAGDYRRLYEGLREAITKHGESPVQGHEALKTIKVIEAAIESHREGRWVNMHGKG